MPTNLYSRPIGRRSQRAANGTRSTWSTITFLGEQQDTSDPEAAILAPGKMDLAEREGLVRLPGNLDPRIAALARSMAAE